MKRNIEDAVRDRVTPDEKTVVGVPGTPFPNREKESLLVTFKLDSQAGRVVFSDDYEETVERRVTGRPEYQDASVTYHSSGSSSAVPFAEQGVTIEIPGRTLAVTQSDIDRLEGIVTRSGDGLEVAEVFYDMEGK
jgi:hypothetical protein